MKPTLFAGIAFAVAGLVGCQSVSWTAKNKSEETAVAENTVVREVPWKWRKDKPKSDSKTELPPHLQAKFEQAKNPSGSTKTAAEWVADGNQLEVARNFAAATEAYEAALRVDPLNAEAHHRLGIMADMRKEYGTARDHYEAALRQKPHDPNLLSDFGYSFHLQNKPQQSEHYLLQSLDLDPQHKQALKNLGTLYASLGRYDDALQAFRRFRPEAEAQKLMAQYFPKGRPMPDGEGVQLAAAGSDHPIPDKNMTAEEILALMQQKKREGIQAREQKTAAELKPNLQDSMTEDDWSHMQAGRTPDSPPRSPAPADPKRIEDWPYRNPTGEPPRNVAANGDPAGPTGGFAAAPPTSGQPDFGEPPLWQGAPVATRSNAPSGSPSDQRGSVPPQGLNGFPDGASPQGGVLQGGARQSPPWWETGVSTADSARPDQYNAQNVAQNMQQITASAAPDANGFAPQNSLRAGNMPGNRAPSRSTMPPDRRAYLLAMSVGPGLMFPVVPSPGDAESRPPAANSMNPPQARFDSQWTSSMNPAGYPETRFGAPGELSDGFADAGASQIAPRSPTENWDSPSSVPWPERGGPNASGQRGSPSAPAPMPVITPGAAPRSNTAPRPIPDSADAAEQDGAGVVPAWYDSPTKTGWPPSGSGSATSVRNWP